MLFVIDKIISDSQHVSKKPADRDGPPDTGNSEKRYGRERVSQAHPGSQRYNCKDDRHSGTAQSAVQPVEEEQNSDQCVKGSFNPQIPDAFRDYSCLSGVDEKRHQRFCKHKDCQGENQAENNRSQDGQYGSLF